MTDWKDCRKAIPENEQEVEVIGYYTYCCYADAEHEISVRKCIYHIDTEIFEAEDNGYMILPMKWRGLENECE